MSNINKNRKFLEFLSGDDLDFYEEFLVHLSEEELEKFMRDNPDFMEEYTIEQDKIELLRDEYYRIELRMKKK